MFRIGLISFIFLLFNFQAEAYQTADSLNRLDEKGRKQGRWIKTDKGIKKYEGQFRDNKPFGRFTYFHENGKTKAITDYSADGKIAYTQLFDLEGSLEAQGKYIDKVKDSTWTFYFKGGNHISSIENWKNGKKNGPMKTYFLNGKVSSECNFVNDNPEGQCKEYFTTGTIKKEYGFKDGLLDGPFKTYFINQLPDISGKYEKALKVGDWVEYNNDGKIRIRKSYRAGILYKEAKENGSFKEFYDSGIPKLEVQYKEGKKEGPFKEYYDIGTWKRVRKPADDDSGAEDFVEVLEGTVLKREGSYVNDKLEGKVTTFDEKGKVVKVETYKLGELQR